MLPYVIRALVHERVLRGLRSFEDALHDAQISPTGESLHRLRDAADELMRATGRVIIEIEQLRDRRGNHE